MAVIRYPDNLPAPWVATIKSNERRALDDLPGLRQTRYLQRDRLATQQMQFVFYKLDDVQTFYAWVRDTLFEGGAWFAADWPLPQGGTGVRKFIQKPAYPTLQGVGVWTVTATCEVRGRGVLPDDGEEICFHERFSQGMFPYGISPAFATSDPETITDICFYATRGGPYGNEIHCYPGGNPALNTPVWIDRAIIARPLQKVSVKFIMSGTGLGDSGVLRLGHRFDNQFVFIPKRDLFVAGNNSQSPVLYLSGVDLFMSDHSLDMDVWFQFDAVLGTKGGTYFTIRRLSTGNIELQTIVLLGNYGFFVEGIEWVMDDSAEGRTTVFADLSLCPTPNDAWDPSTLLPSWKAPINDLHKIIATGRTLQTVRSLTRLTGKRYVELVFDVVANMTLGGIGLDIHDPTILGSDLSSIGYDSAGRVTLNGVVTTGFTTLTSGDILMIAVNQTTGQVWFGVNGVWQGGDPITGAGEQGVIQHDNPLYVLASIDTSSGPLPEITGQFDKAHFTYSAPVGFTGWAD